MLIVCGIRLYIFYLYSNRFLIYTYGERDRGRERKRDRMHFVDNNDPKDNC